MTTTRNNTAIYTGVTSNLKNRLGQHLAMGNPFAFTARYKCHKLVYYREFPDIEAAIAEEKRIKGGSRKNKIRLIEDLNPDWKDLGATLFSS